MTHLETTAEPSSARVATVEGSKVVAPGAVQVFRPLPGSVSGMVFWSVLVHPLVLMLRHWPPTAWDMTFYGLFAAIVVLLVEVGTRAACVHLSDDGFSFPFSGKETPWVSVVQVERPKGGLALNLVLNDGRHIAIPGYAAGPTLLELSRRCGQGVFAGAKGRSSPNSYLDEPIRVRTKDLKCLAAYALLVCFSFSVSCAIVPILTEHNWPALIVSIGLAICGFWMALTYTAVPRKHYRTGEAILDNEGITLTSEVEEHRVVWANLRLAVLTGTDEKYADLRRTSLILVDDRDYVQLPPGFSPTDKVIRLASTHAPADAALYGLGR